MNSSECSCVLFHIKYFKNLSVLVSPLVDGPVEKWDLLTKCIESKYFPSLE